MPRLMLVSLLLGMSVSATAADDLRVSQLEQDVRDLQRQVQALTRQLESQRVSAPPPAGAGRPRDVASGGAPSSPTPAWVDASKWQRVKPGMGELEVLGILGQPTAMRTEEGVRVLYYALEVGAGFLSGSVRLRDRSVLAVQRPVLQ